MERPDRRIFEWPFGRSCVTSHMPPPLRTSRPRSGPRPGPQAQLSNLNSWHRQDVDHLADDWPYTESVDGRRGKSRFSFALEWRTGTRYFHNAHLNTWL
jgi:hypothetical protein